MPTTYCSLHYHVVFSTKDRYPLITKDWRDNLHAYLGGIVKNLKAVPLAVGGIDDHVHLLMGLRATHTVASVMREVKGGSSEWIHKTVGKLSFVWQPGYFGPLWVAMRPCGAPTIFQSLPVAARYALATGYLLTHLRCSLKDFRLREPFEPG